MSDASSQNSGPVTYFYLDKHNQSVGPFSLEQIVKFLETDVIVSESYIWSDGYDNWKQVCDVPEFKPALALISSRKQNEQERKKNEDAKATKGMEVGCYAIVILIVGVIYALLKSCHS